MRTLLCSLLFCSAVQAADLYVSPSGNDGNAGSLSSPKRTIAHAVSLANSGDTVWVREGSYPERVSFPRSGTADAPITLSAYPGEAPIMDLNGQAPIADQSDQPIIRIENRSHITVQGLTLRNWRTADQNALPEGILVAARGGSGVATNIRILRNTLYAIEQNNPGLGNFDANAHGIKVAGRSSTANSCSHIIIEGNHLHHLRLGASEALVINGNVTNFKVTNNYVHHCNNIGIDFIGYENPSMSMAIDRARDGVCSGNHVHDIDSAFNPAYNGNLTSGGGERAAAGIYVDGGTNIIIERNIVSRCNYGVELATEADLSAGANVSLITLRNNLIHHNQQAGLILGGYNSGRGSTEDCLIDHNTFFENGTVISTVQIHGQHHVQNNVFTNNILIAPANSLYVVGVYPSGASSTFTGNTWSHNLYHSSRGAVLFSVGGNRNLSSWQGAASLSGGDNGSTDELPAFAESALTIPLDPRWFAPAAGSPAIDTGSAAFTAADDELDLLGRSRVRGGRVDRGAIER